MTDEKSIHDFNREVDCTYEEEKYSVRDNGAVLKHSHAGKRPRPTDNQWTFGKPNIKTGYLEIASVRVHRIVATAFHGEAPSKEHVVDHIDTNKRNNRPENLRWLTRLENVLQNPITVKRIELACGCSIEEFLADPSKFRDKFQEPNYEWMCTVSKEEAQLSYERMLKWAKSDKKPIGGGGASLGEWIFNPSPKQFSRVDEVLIEQVFKKVKEVTGLTKEELSSKTKKRKYLTARVYAATQLRSEIGLSEEDISKLVGVSKSMVNTYLNHPDYFLQNDKTNQINYQNSQQTDHPEIIESKPSNAVQSNWKVPSEFPCCPQEYGDEPIKTYAENLKTGLTFCQNKYYTSLIYKSAISGDSQTIYVMTESKDKGNAVKPWAFAKITHENGLFVHTNLGSFFKQDAAEKQFFLAQGLEWTGGETFDELIM